MSPFTGSSFVVEKKTWQSLNIPFSLPGSFVNIRLRRRNPTTFFAFLQNVSAFILFSANFPCEAPFLWPRFVCEYIKASSEWNSNFPSISVHCSGMFYWSACWNKWKFIIADDSSVIKSSFFWSQSALLRCWLCGEFVSRASSKNKTENANIFSFGCKLILPLHRSPILGLWSAKQPPVISA